jgi:myosin heavy subunit
VRSNVKIMRTINLLCFALFITITVLLTGCGKTNPKLESENADLKARIQKLEQQLQVSNAQMASQASQPASTPDLKGQLDEVQKKADTAANDLQTLNGQVEAQKAKIDELTRDLSNAQQAREKAEKALELYQDRAASAIQQFQALRSTLVDKTAEVDAYHQNYPAAQTAVTKLVDPLPESKVRRAILGVLATCTHMNDTWETAARQIQARTKTAQADYDKLLTIDGIGTNDYSINMGKNRILAPAEQENAATASRRDQQMVSLEKDLDLGIKNLQALVNGSST